jgi:hypothetical protein
MMLVAPSMNYETEWPAALELPPDGHGTTRLVNLGLKTKASLHQLLTSDRSLVTCKFIARGIN